MLTQKNVYYIGIGGIGVSSLAQYYLATNWKVSGRCSKAKLQTILKKRRKNFNQPEADPPWAVDLVIHL